MSYFEQNIAYSKPGIQDLTIRRGQSSWSIVFIFVSCQEKGYYCVVSLGQLSFDYRSYCKDIIANLISRGFVFKRLCSRNHMHVSIPLTVKMLKMFFSLTKRCKERKVQSLARLTKFSTLLALAIILFVGQHLPKSLSLLVNRKSEERKVFPSSFNNHFRQFIFNLELKVKGMFLFAIYKLFLLITMSTGRGNGRKNVLYKDVCLKVKTLFISIVFLTGSASFSTTLIF